jgi:hypothetical protein
MNGSGFGASLAAVIGLFVGVSIVATLVSKNANTANVIQSAGSALSAVLKAATAPVSGGLS